jgi:hypothetical protein
VGANCSVFCAAVTLTCLQRTSILCTHAHILIQTLFFSFPVLNHRMPMFPLRSVEALNGIFCFDIYGSSIDSKIKHKMQNGSFVVSSN